jgi:amidase
MLEQIARVWQTRPEKDWKSIAQRKQQERLALLPTKWTIDPSRLPAESTLDVTQLCDKLEWLNEEELAITGLSVVELAVAIKEGRYSALTVIEAYGHRATIAQQLVNP